MRKSLLLRPAHSFELLAPPSLGPHPRGEADPGVRQCNVTRPSILPRVGPRRGSDGSMPTTKRRSDEERNVPPLDVETVPVGI